VRDGPRRGDADLRPVVRELGLEPAALSRAQVLRQGVAAACLIRPSLPPRPPPAPRWLFSPAPPGSARISLSSRPRSLPAAAANSTTLIERAAGAAVYSSQATDTALQAALRSCRSA